MKLPRVESFQEHDQVRKGDEIGVVILAKNGRTGERFPMVWILEGPRKGTREYPRRGWTVALDWVEKDGVEETCVECERLFKRKRITGDGEFREIFCKECVRQMQVREQREQTAETIRDQRLGARRRVVTR